MQCMNTRMRENFASSTIPRLWHLLFFLLISAGSRLYTAMSSTIVVASLCWLAPAAALRLVTTTTVAAPPARVTAFLATPANWPSVVLSSQSVEGVDGSDMSAPLKVGDSVDEIFGAPPVLPLRVRWTCTRADSEEGRLTFSSPAGLSGVASQCAMDFTVAADGEGRSSVELAMEYEPLSPIATLATPLLAADNTIARLMLGRAMGV